MKALRFLAPSVSTTIVIVAAAAWAVASLPKFVVFLLAVAATIVLVAVFNWLSQIKGDIASSI